MTNNRWKTWCAGLGEAIAKHALHLSLFTAVARTIKWNRPRREKKGVSRRRLPLRSCDWYSKDLEPAEKWRINYPETNLSKIAGLLVSTQLDWYHGNTKQGKATFHHVSIIRALADSVLLSNYWWLQYRACTLKSKQLLMPWLPTKGWFRRSLLAKRRKCVKQRSEDLTYTLARTVKRLFERNNWRLQRCLRNTKSATALSDQWEIPTYERFHYRPAKVTRNTNGLRVKNSQRMVTTCGQQANIYTPYPRWRNLIKCMRRSRVWRNLSDVKNKSFVLLNEEGLSLMTHFKNNVRTGVATMVHD